MAIYKSLANDMYEAYGDHRGWKTYDDKPMPQWNELPQEIRDAWEAAENVIFTIIRSDLKLEQRDTKTIRGAITYRNQFSDAGFPGHNLLLLVAKLANALRLE